MRSRVTVGALTALVLLGAAACSSSGAPQPPASAFLPSSATASASAASAAAGYVMPPFGSNAHVTMTSYTPSVAAEAGAVNADKDFQLAYLYAEYTGGKDTSWTDYVAPGGAQTTVEQSLTGASVTTESFKGSVSYFDMSVIPDPTTKSAYDVLSCMDSAGAVTTNLTTGAVVPEPSSSVSSSSGATDQDYERLGDILLQDSTGQWQVISSFPTIYYPQAPECKP